ncbi:MAG: PrsW family intramembrane metalloprotease [Chloroflexi bacterium]|nr:PrsW family intramembrane metalloprotease [Chloroflexota bacterium]
MRNHLLVARESVWVQVAGVLIFAALVAAVDNLARPQLSGNALIGAGIVLAIVPAVLWLWMFYRQDRFEPEPRQYVIGVFVLGALLAYAVGQPVIRSLFRVQDWIGANVFVALLGSILVNGLVTQFLLYAAVRYSVFHSSEFDQRIDGIIYGAAAGLGYATMFNLQYVVGHSGVDLGTGVIRIAIESLSLASLGGISGYFLARAKFDKMGPLWLPIGLVIAAALNGIIDLALDEIPMLGSGFGFNPWYGLAAAVVIAGAIFATLFRLIYQLGSASVQVGETQSTAVLDKVLFGKGKREEPEWMVWLVVAIGLLLGWALATLITGETRTASAANMTITYPASWARLQEPGAAMAAYDLDRGGLFGARVSTRVVPITDLLPPNGILEDAANNWAFTRQQGLDAFRLLEIQPTRFQGREAVRIEYVYVMDSPRASPGSAVPALMRSSDTLVASADKIYILSFATESHEYKSTPSLQEQLLAGWRVP